ncbi:OLC1v1025731C1 [Oldenlandia corymbosa var. corymbosa]|uniref:OLC1v1025731C1 n=1 Tax=Oldenlandia corymbosa var. corymbosa TaxID=529605 RepID=A0AAV1C635_OLDCO|nr:OLC1v1025731C1 [Oldenlandia corymbosa var. corymbosa]
MATAFGTAATSSAASSVAANISPNSSPNLPLCPRHSHSKVTFRLSSKPKLRFSSTKGWQSSWNRSAVVRAQSNEVSYLQSFSLEELFSNFHSFVNSLLGSSVSFKVAVDGAKANAPAKSAEVKDPKPSSEPAPVATEESISEFMTQVASLVKYTESQTFSLLLHFTL